MFDFFKRRRERESAVQVQEPSQALGSFAKSDEVVGQQVGGGSPEASFDLQGLGAMDGLAMLSQLGPMIQKAIAEGNVTIEQGPSQTIDMRGSALGEEVREILKQHGLDPDGATAPQSIDPSGYGDMQQQILGALAKHGFHTGEETSDTTINLEVKKED